MSTTNQSYRQNCMTDIKCFMVSAGDRPTSMQIMTKYESECTFRLPELLSFSYLPYQFPFISEKCSFRYFELVLYPSSSRMVLERSQTTTLSILQRILYDPNHVVQNVILHDSD
jgi:hypothetical protein